jgi:site-specific recombinase XerD
VIITTTAQKPCNKGRKLPPEILTPDEASALLNACSKRAPTGIRNRALITVLYRGQLRISEALGLMPSNIDLEAGTLRVLHGKGDKARTVGLDDGALAVLELWLVKRKALGLTGRQPVFCTLQGKPLKDSYCRALLARLGTKARIDKRVHPHGLRHTGAAEMRIEGIDIGIISKQLGHATIATTSRYLDHISPTAVVQAMRARKWQTPETKDSSNG